MGKHRLYHFIYILCRKLTGRRQRTGWSDTKFDAIYPICGQKQGSTSIRVFRRNSLDIFSELFDNIRHITNVSLRFTWLLSQHFYWKACGDNADFSAVLSGCDDRFLPAIPAASGRIIKYTINLYNRQRGLRGIIVNPQNVSLGRISSPFQVASLRFLSTYSRRRGQ